MEGERADKKDVEFDAPWAQNLKHRPDPNRVMRVSNRTPQHSDRALRDAPVQHDGEPGYYDIPMLKQPVWKWQIAGYMYLGGLSAGTYLISRIMDRFGGDDHRDASRIGAYLSLAALLPCPPLLIWDLGDPKRFHHMLRVWKPSSPMNLGTWSIVAYSGMATYEVVRRYLTDRDIRLSPRARSKLLKVMNNGTLLLLHDASGIPFALMVAGYTGVLLSCTANPLWCKNSWLGPLFSASAISTGAEALSLALDLTTRDRGVESRSQSILRKVDTAAHVAELACLVGFKSHAGERAKVLNRGAVRTHHRISLGGIIAAEVLKQLPVGPRLQKPVRMVAAALGLAAGFSMRWSMVFGGHAAAADPHLSRDVSRPRQPKVRAGRRRAGGIHQEKVGMTGPAANA